MKYVILAGAALAAGTLTLSPAFAQESGSESWSGPYVGASVGKNWVGKGKNETILFDTDLNGSFDNNVTTTANANAFSPGFCGGAALTNAPAGGCRKDKGGLDWAGHFGYDMQTGGVVLGLVLEAGKSRVRDSVSGFSTTPASYTLSRRLNWNAAARLRVGVPVMERTLVYGTGGLAYGKVENAFATTNTFNSFTERGAKDNVWGWTAGGGVEHRIGPALSIGLLYKYTRYGADDYRVNAGQGTPASTTNPFVRPVATAGSTDFARSRSRLSTSSLSGTASFRF